MLILSFMAQHPLEGQGLLIIRGYTIIFRHHKLYDSSGPVISPTQTHLPDNIRHSQQTSMPQAGFEPTVPANKQPQTDALNRAAIGVYVGSYITYISRSSYCNLFLSVKLTLTDMLKAVLAAVKQKSYNYL